MSSPIFFLDTAPFALAAVPSGRILVALSERQRRETRRSLPEIGYDASPIAFLTTGVLYIDVERWNREKIGDERWILSGKTPIFVLFRTNTRSTPFWTAILRNYRRLWNTRPLPRWRKGSLRYYQSGYHSPCRVAINRGVGSARARSCSPT